MSIVLDRSEIQGILPHRDPFLFVDAVTSIESGASIRGEFSVDSRTQFFVERDGEPSLAPTILTEAMAQVGAILVLFPEEKRGRTIYFSSIQDAEFHRPVRAGSTVVISAEVKRLRSRFGSLAVSAAVSDELAAKAVMSFALG